MWEPIASLVEPTGLIALCGVALGLGVIAWRARREPSAARDQIRLVSTRFFGGKKFVALIEVEGERLLLGLTGDSVRVLARLGRAGRPGRQRLAVRAPLEGRAGEIAAGERSRILLAEQRG